MEAKTMEELPRKKDYIKYLKRTGENVWLLLRIAFRADKWLVVAYYGSAVIGAIMPVGVGLASKYLIDYLNGYVPGGNKMLAGLVWLLAYRYIMTTLDGLIYWVYNVSYVDYLFRSRFQNEINCEFYKKMISMDAGYFEDAKVQNLISKTRDTKTWKLPDMLRGLSYITRSATMAILSGSVLITYGLSWPIIVALTCLPRLISQTKQGQIQWSVYGSGAPKAKRLWYFEWMMCEPQALKEMRIFQSGEYLLRKFRQVQAEIFDMFKKPLNQYLPVWIGLTVWEMGVIFLITLMQIYKLNNGLLTVGGLILFVDMVVQLKGNIVNTAIELGALFSNNLYVEDFKKVLNLPDLVKESRTPVKIDTSKPPKIEFKKVWFRYPGKKTWVLKNINLKIEKGKNVALVGINGAGKSTMIKLICRFYDVTKGEILIDNVNIKKIAKKDLYKLMGTLFQEFVHFHFSVRENIAMGDPENFDLEKMKTAAKQAGADLFIDKFDKGYEQMLGREFDDGEEISGGQWQKLAIARAFYEQAPLLILDEPTSAIDAEAEFEIFSNLQNIYRDKTLVLVSHRFSTVRNADMIYVIDKGGIEEAGDHEELMKNNGKYSQMFLTQAKGYRK